MIMVYPRDSYLGRILFNINLCDWNGIRTYNHLVRKPTLNHLAKLAAYVTWLEHTVKYTIQINTQNQNTAQSFKEK